MAIALACRALALACRSVQTRQNGFREYSPIGSEVLDELESRAFSTCVETDVAVRITDASQELYRCAEHVAMGGKQLL